MTEEPSSTPADIPLESSFETQIQRPPSAGDKTVPIATPVPQPLSPDAPPVIPDVVLDKALGQGGMGAVYKGRQLTLDRTIAVKAIHPGLAKDRSFVERFEREAKVLAKLSHPNIVTCYSAGCCVQTGKHYLLMEFVEGDDLLKRVRKQGPLAERDALVIGKQVAEGLEHALEAGVIHRDVKPENILLKPVQGRAATSLGVQAKIVDLGLAALASPDKNAPHLTEAGTSLGTPLTMAPEQAEAPETIDHRADIYGLGCTLYFALTGRFPHEGATIAQVISKKLRDETANPKTLRADLSDSTAALVLEMMSFDPEKRPATYEKLVARLDMELAKFPSASTKVESQRAPVPPAAAALTAPMPTPVPVKDAPPPPSRGGVKVAGAALLVAAAIIGVRAFRADDGTPKGSTQPTPPPVTPTPPPTPPVVTPPPTPPAPTPTPPPTAPLATEPPRLAWSEPTHIFGEEDDLFSKLAIDAKDKKAWRHPNPDDDQKVACDVDEGPVFAPFKITLDAAVRINGFVLPRTAKDLGVRFVFDKGTVDVGALCQEKFRPGTDTAETTRRWAIQINPSDPPAVLYQDGVKGIRQRMSAVYAHGLIWARLADAPNAAWTVAAAPGKLEKVGLYVLDGVGSFDDFTVETAHE